MAWWRRRRLLERIGIWLTAAGCLFFFVFLTDIERCMVRVQCPYLLYQGEAQKQMKEILVELGFGVAMPLPTYAKNVNGTPEADGDEENLWASIDAQAKYDRDYAKASDQEDARRKLEEENERARQSVSGNHAAAGDEAGAAGEARGGAASGAADGSGRVPGETDAGAAGSVGGSTGSVWSAAGGNAKGIKREKPVCEVDLKACQSFEELVKTFYVIDSSTYIDESELNVGMLLGQDFSLPDMPKTAAAAREAAAQKKAGQAAEAAAQEAAGPQETEEAQKKTAQTEDAQAEAAAQATDYSKTENPQILIYHTHSQEGYADSVPGDDSTTVMGAGEELARILSEEYGFRVLHHTGKYDVGNRDYAYSEALPELKKVLAKNPGIEVVIDLHRDGVADLTRLVTELDGKKTAQVMLFNGLSRTRRIGEIEYLKNDYRQSNLAFSFQLQKKMMEYYPGLARKIYLKGYRYNMHFRPRSLLIELGAQTNTREEVWNSLEPLAHSLAMVLCGE